MVSLKRPNNDEPKGAAAGPEAGEFEPERENCDGKTKDKSSRAERRERLSSGALRGRRFPIIGSPTSGTTCKDNRVVDLGHLSLSIQPMLHYNALVEMAPSLPEEQCAFDISV